MSQGIDELMLEPGQYDGVPVYKLLEAAARGYIGVDHRFLHAILDHPEQAIPHLVRFAAEDHEDDAVDLDPQVLDMFRYLKTPEAIPFLLKTVRQDTLDVSDEVVECFSQLGAASVEPLLGLLQEMDEDSSHEVAFLLATTHIRDPRILEALTRRLDSGNTDAVWNLDIYGDPAAIPALEAALARVPEDDAEKRKTIQTTIKVLALTQVIAPEGLTEPPEPFDIWDLYAEKDTPAFDVLSEDQRLTMLEKGSAELRADVAQSYRSSTPSDKARARLLEHAKQDPDLTVRAECWEALGDIADEPEVRRAMLAVLSDPNASSDEKGGAAIALAQQSDNNVVFQAIEQLYAAPGGRAKALKAMARSFDRRFAAYPPKHLDDPDPETRRQAIWGVGYLNLPGEAPRLEAFFDDEEFRSDALFAYALSVPGDTSRGRIRSLLKKVDEAAGGFKPDEEELIQIALDQRLMLHGMKPFFFADEDADEEPETMPAVSAKVNRNEPCPCGSGKKYKKCCGQ